ncbi:MAG: phosphoglycerate mutase family protein [Candidatus Komeilibacteria bacterium]
MLPRNIILIRHGESEGNIANKRSRKGDHSAFSQEFRQRHSSTWRLTDRGIWQAQSAGLWLSQAGLTEFGRKYTSEYLRAKETALYLGLGGVWMPEFYLRERDWGALDVIPEDERQEKFGADLAKRASDCFYWAPPGNPSQSMADLCLRIDRVLATLHRECSHMPYVAIVCHGEVMWALCIRLERMTQFRYRELDASKHPFDHIHNCQIIHFSRLNPVSGEETTRMTWKRSICPWDTSLSSNEWQKIERRVLTEDNLRAEIERVPRLINNPVTREGK